MVAGSPPAGPGDLGESHRCPPPCCASLLAAWPACAINAGGAMRSGAGRAGRSGGRAASTAGAGDGTAGLGLGGLVGGPASRPSRGNAAVGAGRGGGKAAGPGATDRARCVTAPSSPRQLRRRAPATPGRGVPHILHESFLANCRSLHVGHIQSPGAPRPRRGVSPVAAERPCARNTGLTPLGGRAAADMAADDAAVPGVCPGGATLEHGAGHAPSPGAGGSAEPYPGAAERARCMPVPPSPPKLARHAPATLGRGVPHILQLKFLANWRSLHPGHVQSPGAHSGLGVPHPRTATLSARPARAGPPLLA